MEDMIISAQPSVQDTVAAQQLAAWMSSEANQIGERIYEPNPNWRPMAVASVKKQELLTREGKPWTKYLATVLLADGTQSAPGDVRIRKGLNFNLPLVLVEEIAKRNVAKFNIEQGKRQYFLHNK